MKAQPATRRRIGVGVVAVLAALLSSACAAGQKAQTAAESPAIDGVSGTVGTIQLHALAIKAPPTGGSYRAGDSAAVTVVVVNSGPAADTLIGVSSTVATATHLFATGAEANQFAAANSPTSTGAASSPGPSSPAAGSAAPSSHAARSAAPSGGGSSAGSSTGLSSLDIPPGGRVTIGVTGQAPVLLLAGLTADLFAGTSVPVTFRFAQAGSVTLSVPVQLSELPSGSGSVIPSSGSGE